MNYENENHFKHSVRMKIILNILSKRGPSATNTTKMRTKKVFKPKKNEIIFLLN